MTATEWTTAADVRSHLRRLWARGRLLADVAQPVNTFPLRVGLRRPTSPELVTRFEEVRTWVDDVRGIGQARLESRDVNHRQLGPNSIPVALWFDTVEAAAATIGTTRELQRFTALVELTNGRYPHFVPLLAKRPLEALAEAAAWPRMLDVVDWMQQHPRPGIYLRQVDIPGVHTKFIEQHQRTLAAMLDAALPESAIEVTAGHSEFARRYGFRGRPRLVRFRSLDRRLALTTIDQDRQYSLTAADFGRIDPPRRIFMTENEINFLAFPDVPDSMAVFGAGSGFDHLLHVPWLAEVPIHYWGDIDTHGFAILDQLRGYAPHATSLLMDRETLLAHREFWGVEEKPTQRNLSRLTGNEHGVYDDLRDNRLQPNLRLEQERIRFSWVHAAVQRACASVDPATET